MQRGFWKLGLAGLLTVLALTDSTLACGGRRHRGCRGGGVYTYNGSAGYWSGGGGGMACSSGGGGWGQSYGGGWEQSGGYMHQASYQPAPAWGSPQGWPSGQAPSGQGMTGAVPPPPSLPAR